MLALLNRSNRWFMLAIFLLALGYGMWMNLRPLYLERLGATPEQVGLVLGLVALAGGLLSIPAGLLADRIGPKRVMVAGYCIAGAGTLLAAAAPSWGVAGVGFALFTLVFASNPASATLVLHHASQGHSGPQISRIMAIVFAAWPAAMVFAPALGGALGDRFGLPAVLGTGALLIFAAAAVLTRTADARPVRGGAGSSAKALLRNRGFLTLIVFFPLVVFAANLGTVLAPNFLETTRGLSLSVIGLLFSVLSVGALLFNAFVGRTPMPRFIGLLVIAQIAGMALLALFSPLWVLGTAFLLLGTLPTIWVVSQSSYGQSVPASQRGTALGVAETLTALSVAVASVLAGQLYERTPTHEGPFVAAIAMLVVMLGALALIPAVRRAVAASQHKKAEPLPGIALAGD
jgi:MFS family permease